MRRAPPPPHPTPTPPITTTHAMHGDGDSYGDGDACEWEMAVAPAHLVLSVYWTLKTASAYLAGRLGMSFTQLFDSHAMWNIVQAFDFVTGVFGESVCVFGEFVCGVGCGVHVPQQNTSQIIHVQSPSPPPPRQQVARSVAPPWQAGPACPPSATLSPNTHVACCSSHSSPQHAQRGSKSCLTATA